MKSLFISLIVSVISFSAFMSLAPVQKTIASSGIEIAQQSTIYDGRFVNGSEENGTETLTSSLYSLEGITTRLLPGIANYIAGALAAVAVLFLVYAGFLFLTAGGDEEKVKTAIKSAFYVLLGLLLLMFAYALVYLFLTLLGSQ